MGCCSSNPTKNTVQKSIAQAGKRTVEAANSEPNLDSSNQDENDEIPNNEIFSFFPLNPSKITNEYRISSIVLGKGAFGVVRKCVHIITGQERAIKIIVKEDLAKKKAQSKLYISEIEIMKSLTHPNLVNVYEYFQDDRFVFIVMELIKGEELLERILKVQRLSETEACVIMEQCVNAINYMHSNGVVHRDIKPENIMLDGSNVKIIDFGGSRRFKPNELMHKVSGTAFYIAPEVLDQAYDDRCDVWSLGVILYIMLTGDPPFPGKTDKEIFEKIKIGKPNFSHAAILLASENCRDLLKKLLVPNYKQRVHLNDIIDHPWFQALRSNVNPLPNEIMGNLRRFSSSSIFQKAIYFYLINNVATPEEKKNLIVAFGQLDLNHDGVLSREEIKIGLREVGLNLSEAELSETFFKITGQESKTINYMEFIAATLDRRRLLSEERISQCFKQFDQDHTGKISIHNFRAILGNKANLTDQQWYELIKIYDLNGDGVIEYSEFREILIKMAS